MSIEFVWKFLTKKLGSDVVKYVIQPKVYKPQFDRVIKQMHNILQYNIGSIGLYHSNKVRGVWGILFIWCDRVLKRKCFICSKPIQPLCYIGDTEHYKQLGSCSPSCYSKHHGNYVSDYESSRIPYSDGKMFLVGTYPPKWRDNPFFDENYGL